MKPITILAIETSLDETAAAVVKGNEILSNIIYSQIDIHAPHGGVVPGLAKLEHEKKLPGIIEEAIARARIDLKDLDLVAVTIGPGQAITLEVGLLAAKKIAREYEIPLLGVNHMEGHLLSSFVGQEIKDGQFPALGVLVSGGHSEFVLVNEVGDYRKIGSTIDDACGEAFDKAARMLGLKYPGGPQISRLASKIRPAIDFELERRHQGLYLVGKTPRNTYELPIPMAFSKDLNVSYSGLKTAFKQLVNELSGEAAELNIRQTGEQSRLTEVQRQELSAMFEEAALLMLKIKLEHALDQHPQVKELWLGGGVVANRRFQEIVSEVSTRRGLELYLPSSAELTADNAAMIGLVAFYKYHRLLKQPKATQLKEFLALNQSDINSLDRQPNLSL